MSGRNKADVSSEEAIKIISHYIKLSKGPERYVQFQPEAPGLSHVLRYCSAWGKALLSFSAAIFSLKKEPKDHASC